MWPLLTIRGSVVLLTLLFSTLAWADAFTRFFFRQKVGQEITVTGRFSRFTGHRDFFERDYKTGEVAYFTYFGTVVTPTMIIGDGSLKWPAGRLETVLLLYPDEGVVKDLPAKGEDLWFTGILIGYQYGVSGITSDAATGGVPYILLKRVSAQPPDGVTIPQGKKPAP